MDWMGNTTGMTSFVCNHAWVKWIFSIEKLDLNAFFFFFFFFFLSSRRFKFESVTILFSMKYGTWFLDEQDTRQNTELKKSVVQSVLCLSCLFIYILTSKFIKNWKKKKKNKQKKIKSWILLNQSRTEKQTRAAALRRTNYFFSLNYQLLFQHQAAIMLVTMESAWKMRNTQKTVWESTRKLFWKQERKKIITAHSTTWQKSFTNIVEI